MRIKKNLKSFVERIKPTVKKIVYTQQTHGAKVAVFKKDSPSLFLGCDALITKEKRTALAIFTADCLSIFLYDFKNKAIGLIHAGWRSVRERIVTKTLKLMRRVFTTEPEDLYIALGPAIRRCCYVVKEEFKDFFPQKYIIKRKDKLYFDLVGINYAELIRCGVNKERILDCLLCTSCNNDILFSYRKENGTSARMVSLAMLT